MKATGIVKEIDEVGRLLIPKEVRKVFETEADDNNERIPVEIFVEGNSVILKRYGADCIFCGSTNDIVEFNGKNICKNCIKKIKMQ